MSKKKKVQSITLTTWCKALHDMSPWAMTLLVPHKNNISENMVRFIFLFFSQGLKTCTLKDLLGQFLKQVRVQPLSLDVVLNPLLQALCNAKRNWNFRLQTLQLLLCPQLLNPLNLPLLSNPTFYKIKIPSSTCTWSSPTFTPITHLFYPLTPFSIQLAAHI